MSTLKNRIFEPEMTLQSLTHTVDMPGKRSDNNQRGKQRWERNIRHQNGGENERKRGT